jgi:hypothetical protein
MAVDIYGSPKRYDADQEKQLKRIKKALGGHHMTHNQMVNSRKKAEQIHKAGRKNLAAYNNGDPTGARSIGDIQREADSATSLKFGDAEKSYNTEIGQDPQQQANIGNWYQNYLNAVQSAHDNTAGAFANAQASMANATAASQNAFNQNQTQINNDAAKSAALRGATVDPNVASTANQAAASNRSSADQFGGLIGTLGASATTNLDTRKSIGAGEEIAQHLLQSKRTGELKSKLRDLLKDKGDYRVVQIGAGRDNERKYKEELAAFGLDQQTAAQKAQAAAADLGLKANSQKISQGNLTERQRHDLAMEQNAANKKASKGAKNITPAAKRTAITKVGTTLGQLKSNIKGGILTRGDGSKFPVNAKNEASFVTLIQSKVGDPYLAKALAQEIIWGGVGPGTESALHKRFGLSLKSFGLHRMN